MAMLGGNQACPCGSGKKYKNCCLRRGVVIPNNISGVVTDRGRKRTALIGGKLLINQFKRDGPKIEASFDRLCMPDLEALSELTGQTAGILLAGLGKATSNADTLRTQCAELTINALNAFGAAVQAVRSGYVLVPGIVMRNVVETLAVVAHLMTEPEDLAKLQAGKFSSTSALAAAKKMIPVFGHWYGFLTEQFSHIGKLHHSLQPVRPYDKMNEPLQLNLSMLRVSLWLTYVIAELLFIDCTASPRYWRRLEDGAYTYAPSTEELAWQSAFLGSGTKRASP
jgi:SEC-C motif